MSTEATTATPAKKAATVYTPVVMEDGRTVQFAGNRKSDKTILMDDAGKATGVRFDFANGKTLSLAFSEIPEATALYACGHGIAQKAGDEYSGVKEVDDMALAVEEIFKRLRSGDWAAAREAGDSTAGASIVIRALMEVTGKPIEFIKTFLDGKLEAAKAKGEKLSRQDLYNSFRNPTSKTGVVIKRLEEEKLAKSNKVDSDALLGEMTA
jgi:hypothetical protein